jgi:hypothetical protein
MKTFIDRMRPCFHYDIDSASRSYESKIKGKKTVVACAQDKPNSAGADLLFAFFQKNFEDMGLIYKEKVLAIDTVWKGDVLKSKAVLEEAYNLGVSMSK